MEVIDKELLELFLAVAKIYFETGGTIQNT